MSYSSSELSVDNGQPVELFKFSQGAQNWYYTSGPDNVVYLAAEYIQSQISRSSISQSSDITKSTLTLEFPRDHEFASQFLGYTPDLITTITIFRSHATDTSVEWVAYWKGRVISSKASGSIIELECEPVFTSMRRIGLRARYQKTCRHTLYSISCGVNIAAFKTTTTVQSSTGWAIVNTASGLQPDGYYTGGLVQLASGALRFIVKHVGSTLHLSRPFIEDISGATIDIYPGCDHLKSTCNAKFANGDNFGGFPYAPNKNPFGSSAIT